MSVINQAIQGVHARVLWSCSDGCVALIERGIREACGYFNALRYEVLICMPGLSRLFCAFGAVRWAFEKIVDK